MGESLFGKLQSKLQSKLELLRLEKRYTRSRHRRSAFVSNAVYVDGEYVFQTPSSTGSSSADTSRDSTFHNSPKGIDALHGEQASPRDYAQPATLVEEEFEDERDADRRMDEEFRYQQQQQQSVRSKRSGLKRFSTIVTTSTRDMGAQKEEEEYQRKRLNRYSSMPGFGGGYDIKTTPRVQERRLSMIQ